MRIGASDPPPGRGGPAPVRAAKPPGTAPESAPVWDVPAVDVVQLTLHSDGMWQVMSSPASEPSPTLRPPRTTLQIPRGAASGTSLYTPSGRLQGSPPPRGVVLDIYV